MNLICKNKLFVYDLRNKIHQGIRYHHMNQQQERLEEFIRIVLMLLSFTEIEQTLFLRLFSRTCSKVINFLTLQFLICFVILVEDTSFTQGSKLGAEEDDPHNINKGFKLRKNSEYDRQLKASITSNISPI